MNPVAPTAVVTDGAVHDESGGAVSTATARGGNGNGGGNSNSGPGNGNGNNGGGNGNGNGNTGGGNGNGNGNGNQPTVPGGNQGPGNQTPTNTTPTTTRKVELEGPITVKTGDAITVRGQEVTVPTTCVIRHGNTTFAFGDLKIGDLVHVRAMRTTTGTGLTATTTIEASEVMVQNPGFASDDGGGGGGTTDALVSVTAFDAVADETGSNPGSFRLTRTGTTTQLASPLTVSFTLSGTATGGSDYTTIPLSATFLANQSTVDVAVAPLADTTTEGSESVILTLTAPPSPYDLGSPSTATVTISDTSSPLVSVTAFDANATEPAAGLPPSDLGTFRFSRTGSTAASLTVTFTLTGTATNGVDYQNVSTTVTFAAGQATVDVFVMPLSDGSAEGSESVVVTVTDGAAYDLGAPSTATVNIAG